MSYLCDICKKEFTRKCDLTRHVNKKTCIPPSKDPIDALRYLAVMQPEFNNSETYKAIGGGSY